MLRRKAQPSARAKRRAALRSRRPRATTRGPPRRCRRSKSRSASSGATSRTRECRISFEAIPGFSQYSLNELNREADRPNFDAFYRDSVGAFYAVGAVAHFDHAGIRGAVIDAISRARPAIPGWRAGLPTRIFMLYTPKGLTKATCSAPPAAFEGRRGEFEAVARAITVPR